MGRQRRSGRSPFPTGRFAVTWTAEHLQQHGQAHELLSHQPEPLTAEPAEPAEDWTGEFDPSLDTTALVALGERRAVLEEQLRRDGASARLAAAQRRLEDDYATERQRLRDEAAARSRSRADVAAERDAARRRAAAAEAAAERQQRAEAARTRTAVERREAAAERVRAEALARRRDAHSGMGADLLGRLMHHVVSTFIGLTIAFMMLTMLVGEHGATQVAVAVGRMLGATFRAVLGGH